MTDRVLTNARLEVLERTANNGYKLSLRSTLDLIASHRLLAERNKELEKAQVMALQIIEATEKLKAENELDD